MASDREFLKGNRAPTPDLMPGMDEETGVASRYKPIEDVSDSEEAEMDLSETDDDDDLENPKKKVARTDTRAADGDSVPRWSNPDPYTALPPPDESQRKKRDVLKLIRKARVNNISDSAAKTEAATDDFMPFDFGDDEEVQELSTFEPQSCNGVEGAPTGPRFSHRDNARQQGSTTSTPLNPTNASHQELDEGGRSLKTESGKVQNGQFSIANGSDAPKLDFRSVPNGPSLPAIPTQLASMKISTSIDLTPDPALGNRKRTFDDEIKGPPKIHGPMNNKGSKPSDGSISKSWQSVSDATATPWVSADHSNSTNMGIW